MIKKKKAYFLKPGIDLEELEKYGFETYNDQSWWRDIPNKPMTVLDSLVCYKNDRIFKIKASRYVWTIKVEKYIQDLIDAGLVYKKRYYYVKTWNCRNWSDKKTQKVTDKVNKLQKIEDAKYE